MSVRRIALGLMAAITLAALTGALAGSAAPAATSAASYSLFDGWGVLHDFGVPGSEEQVSGLLLDTCSRMSTSQSSMLALQRRLEGPYPGNGGDVMAIASDVFCPQFGPTLSALAKSEIH